MTEQPHRRRQERPPSRELSTRTLQVVGIALIIGTAIFWAFTHRQSSLLMGAGVTLATLGWVRGAFITIQAKIPRYDVPDEGEEEYLSEEWDRRDDPPRRHHEPSGEGSS